MHIRIGLPAFPIWDGTLGCCWMREMYFKMTIHQYVKYSASARYGCLRYEKKT